MRGDAEAAEPLDVVDDIARLAAKRIRRGRHVDGDVVTAACADFCRVEAQHALAIHRRIQRTSRVAVVGEHDELEAGPRGGMRDLAGCAAAVRPHGVDVKNARNRAVGKRR